MLDVSSLFLVVGLLWLAWELFMFRKSNGLPTLRTWPLIGSLPSLIFHKDRLAMLQEANEKYGERLQFFSIGLSDPLRIIWLFNPDHVHYFLETNFKNYERRTPNVHFKKLFGEGIFVANGKSWKRQRQTARHLFYPTHLETMVPIFQRNGDVLLSQLNEARIDKKPVDIQELFMRFTLDSIGEIGFGHSINSLNQPVAFSHAFNEAQRAAEAEARNPLKRFVKDRDFEKHYETLHAFTREIIHKRKAANDYHDRTDMLSRFMCGKDPITNEPFTDESLEDILLNFFIAGRDTTAILLTWTFYLLAKNPDVEQKLIDEVDTVLKGEKPTMQTVSEMPYLRKVLDETLRLYPPVPSDGRTAKDDDVLPDGTKVPAGTILVYSAYVMGRSKEHWDEPLRFNPDRWDKPLKNPRAFVPFHAGPQTCLGKPMAYLEAKMVVSQILQKFRFRLVPGHEVFPTKSIVMPAAHGVKVYVEARQ
ncbi:Cytochrome P450 family-dependent fatty acid hydroxylase [Balamuthia mandrillaris]